MGTVRNQYNRERETEGSVVARRYPWLFVTFGVVVVIGIYLFLAGDRGAGAFFIVMGAVSLWEAWIVSGGGRRRPSPRLVTVAKHGSLLVLLLAGSIWIVVIGIGYLARGDQTSGWWRIALAVLLAVAFLFFLRRALRDYG
jgi:hypothetical protein